jgi:hypothetical protein
VRAESLSVRTSISRPRWVSLSARRAAVGCIAGR